MPANRSLELLYQVLACLADRRCSITLEMDEGEVAHGVSSLQHFWYWWYQPTVAVNVLPPGLLSTDDGCSWEEGVADSAYVFPGAG